LRPLEGVCDYILAPREWYVVPEPKAYRERKIICQHYYSCPLALSLRKVHLVHTGCDPDIPRMKRRREKFCLFRI